MLIPASRAACRTRVPSRPAPPGRRWKVSPVLHLPSESPVARKGPRDAPRRCAGAAPGTARAGRERSSPSSRPRRPSPRRAARRAPRAIPSSSRRPLRQPRGPDPARNALAAGFVLEEVHDGGKHGGDRAILPHDDDGPGAEGRSRLLEGVIVHGQVEHGRGHKSPGGAAQEDGQRDLRRPSRRRRNLRSGCAAGFPFPLPRIPVCSRPR